MWLRGLKFVLLTALLAACGTVAQPQAASAPEGAVRGEALPGRLLFVRQGVIWQWQGREGRPLFGNGELAQPAWSPQGDRIAYIARANSSSDLLLADATGSALARLTEHDTTEPPNSLARVHASRWALYPAWAPNGVQIALASQPAPPEGDPPAEYNLDLMLVPIGPGAAQPLFTDHSAQAGRSAFSADGASLVFTRAGVGAEGRQRLYRLEVASGAAEPVPGAPEPSYDPACSPDGVWLTFAARDTGRTDIFVLPAGGGGTPLTRCHFLTALAQFRAGAVAASASECRRSAGTHP